MERVVSVTPRPRFTPGKGPPGTHRIRGWVGLRTGLDTEARGKILHFGTDNLLLEYFLQLEALFRV
jgi:hypothetical protein